MNRNLLVWFAGQVLVFGMAAESQAQLLGKQLEIAAVYQGSVVLGPIQVTVVDPGAELTNLGGANQLDIDILNDGILVTANKAATHGASPNLLTFTDFQGTIPAFTDVAFFDASPVFNNASRIDFSADTFSYDFDGTTVAAGDFFRLKVSVVPEPSALALAAIGTLLGYGLRHRKQQRVP